MEFIFRNFPGNKNDFVFFKKTIFYTSFVICYDLLFGINYSPAIKATPRKIHKNIIDNLKVKGDRIRERIAPSNVLEACDRRTTNPKERNIVFTYLK